MDKCKHGMIWECSECLAIPLGGSLLLDLQEKINTACKNDKSHVKRLSENEVMG